MYPVTPKFPNRRQSASTTLSYAVTTIRFLFLALMAAMIGYTYDSYGHITGLGGGSGGIGGGPLCAGGIFPIIIYGCNSGVVDVDCGNNDGCLSRLIAKCPQMSHDHYEYEVCVRQVTTKCMIYGYLRPPDQGHIMGCAAQPEIP